MSTQENVQVVKDFFAAMGRGDKQGLLALSAEDIEWIIPGEDWPLAGTHRGHAGLAAVLKKASETVETSFPKPPEFVAQGDRVLVVGFATGKIKATNRAFRDDWVFAITVQNDKVTKIREYIDTQAPIAGIPANFARDLAARYDQHPGQKGRPALEAAVATPGFDSSLLQHIIGNVAVSHGSFAIALHGGLCRKPFESEPYRGWSGFVRHCCFFNWPSNGSSLRKLSRLSDGIVTTGRFKIQAEVVPHCECKTGLD